MRVLAIDTALAACSAALLTTGEAGPAIAEVSEPMTRGHAEALMPLVQQLLEDEGAGFHDIDRMAVTVGPGTFTGIRVGIAAARGLALATGCEICGVSTLSAYAGTALIEVPELAAPFAVAIDARRGELYVQAFADARRAIGEPMVAPADEAVAALPGSVGFAYGTGAGALAAAANSSGREIVSVGGLPAPRVRAVALAAVKLPGGALPEGALPPEPLYLRPPDAKPQTGKSVAMADAD